MLSLQIAVLFGIEAGAGFPYPGQVAMAQDLSRRMIAFQPLQQLQQGLLLMWRTRVGRMSLLVQPALIANAQGMLVITLGMSAYQLFMPCLVSLPAAGDVVVVARKPEPLGMAADKGGNGKLLITPGSTTMNDNQFYSSHFSLLTLSFFTLIHAAGYTQAGSYRSKDSDNRLNDELPSFSFHKIRG